MAQVTLTQAESGKSVQVKVGDLIVVRLGENPTTGYRWAEEQRNPEVIALLNTDYAQTTGAGVGGGGEKTFTFKAARAGSSPVQLKLSSEWPRENPVIQRFGITVQVVG